MNTLSYCIAGLGNPGDEYAMTRHNAGRLFLQFFLKASPSPRPDKIQGCDVWRVQHKGVAVLLAAPRSYMNESGPPLLDLIRFLKIPPDCVLLCHDDVDLDLGRVQFKRGGSSAGHRGVESLYSAAGHSDFFRLRIGIGRGKAYTRDYVLSEFAAEEQKILEGVFSKCINGIDFWIDGNADRCAQTLNTISTPS